MNLRSIAERLFQGLTGLGTVVVIGTLLVVAITSRPPRDAATAIATAAPTEVGISSATPSPTLAPATAEPTTATSLSPTAKPSIAAPTPSVARPTPTSKPVVDPRPEGTPHYHVASGHVGETIVNDEITIRVVSASIPASFDIGLCAHNDPTSPEAIAFEVTESWTRWTSVDWGFEMGSAPFVNWIENPPSYSNGESVVIVACHHPGDVKKIVIYSGPLEHTDVPEDYRWTFT
jgi:hypothetical protein